MKRHIERCDCDICSASDKTQAFKELAENEKKNIKDYGWYCHMVAGGDDQTPTGVNYHTHGCLESFGHLDLQIVAPIPGELAHGIFCLTIEKIRAGEKLEAGKRISEILDSMDVTLKETKEHGRTVLRVILPDSKGELDEEKMDEPFNTQWADPTPRTDLINPSLN